MPLGLDEVEVVLGANCLGARVAFGLVLVFVFRVVRRLLGRGARLCLLTLFGALLLGGVVADEKLSAEEKGVDVVLR